MKFLTKFTSVCVCVSVSVCVCVCIGTHPELNAWCVSLHLQTREHNKSYFHTM